MSDGNFNNPGSVSPADQSFGRGVAAQQPGPGPLPFPPAGHPVPGSPGPPGPSGPPGPPGPPGPSRTPSNAVASGTSFNQSPDAGTAITYSRGDHAHGTPSDADLQHRLAETVTVAISGGQFTSVAAALASIAGLPDATHPYVVDVAAGTYSEPPFTIPPYVVVLGNDAVNLVASTNSANFVTGSPNALLKNVTVYGPSGFGMAAIYHNTPGPASFNLQNILLGSGYYGLNVVGGKVLAQTILNTGSGTFNKFVRVSAGGNVTIAVTTFQGVTGAVVQGYVATGPGTVLSLFDVTFSCDGADATFTNDGALCQMLSCQLLDGLNAIHVGLDGSPVVLARSVAVQNTLSGHFTNDILIETSSATVHFSGSARRGSMIIPTGTTFSASFQDVTTGSEGETTIGTTFTARSDNPTVVLPLSKYLIDTISTGLHTGGLVTKNGGLGLHITAGTSYLDDDTDAFPVDWGGTDITLAPSSTEYIYIDQSGLAQHSPSRPDYTKSIVLAQAVTSATDILLLTRDEITVDQILPRLQEYLEDVVGPINLAGASTTINGIDPLSLDVDAGQFDVGLSERDVIGGTEVTFTYWYETSPGVWVAVPGATEIDTGNYNDISSGLVPVTAGMYKKDVLYVVVNNGGDEYHVVYGQELFGSQLEAESGDYPVPMYILEHYGMRSGGIVSLANAIGIASVVDARPKLGGYIPTAGGVTVHGGLSGLGADDHLQYFNVTRGNTWHFSTPTAGEAHVKNGNAHAHTPSGDGGQVSHTSLNNIGVNTHPQIDAHIASTANPHATTISQAAVNGDGSLSIGPGNAVKVGTLADDSQHGDLGGGSLHDVATGASAGFESAADKAKLDGIATGAAALTSSAPANVDNTAAAVGAGTTAARSDHKHAVNIGVPGTATFGSASAGTATTLALSDHAHAVASPSAPANVDNTAAAAGTSPNIARQDHKHSVNTGTPVNAGGTANSAGTSTTLSLSDHVHAIIFGASYQQVNDPTRTTLTGAGSTSYPPAGGATKLTMTTPALAAGTYKLAWAAIIDYSSAARDMNIRIQDTTDTVTLSEEVYRPVNAADRSPYSGQALITFAGIAKTIAMQFHTANVGDTAGVAFAYMDISRVL